MKNPRLATGKPHKTPGQISRQLAYIFAKITTFPGKKSTFSNSTKISDDLFLVINSDFLTFFTRKQRLIPYFSAKSLSLCKNNSKIHIFRGNLKNPEKPKFFCENPSKALGLREKT